MAVTITPSDIQVYASVPDDRAQALIDGTLARAAQFAPCILDPDLDEVKAAAAKDILVGVITRAVDGGSGVVTTLLAGAGQFSKTVDASKPTLNRFRPSDIRELKELCGRSAGGAFTITLGYDQADAGIEDHAADE